MDNYNPLPAATTLPDLRLRTRLDTLLDTFSQHPDSTIPQATADRNHMDAAYAFFHNARVTPERIVATARPEALADLHGADRILCIQDTTDLNYSALEHTTGLGYTDGHNTRGLKLHSTLAVRADGHIAGLLTQQLWTRPHHQKGKAAARRRRDTRDKESLRWSDHAQAAQAVLPTGATVVHIADREGDIYHWFAQPRPAQAHLLVRVAQTHRIAVSTPAGVRGHLGDIVAAQTPWGQQVITVPRADGRAEREAILSVRVAAVDLQPPRHARCRSQLSPVPVWVVEAREEKPPTGTEAVDWRLVTTAAITTWEEALRALREYGLRWLIERFHFVLKSGFGVEDLQLETADRLSNAVAVYSQAAARVLRLTYRSRVEPEASASSEFSAAELAVLEGERDRRSGRSCGSLRTLVEAVAVLGQLGGHVGRPGDGPPGVKVLWRGLKALQERVLGFLHGQSAPPLSTISP